MLYNYRITIVGRIQSDSQAHAFDQIKSGLSLSLPLHDSVDDLAIHAEADESLDEMKRRFPDG